MLKSICNYFVRFASIKVYLFFLVHDLRRILYLGVDRSRPLRYWNLPIIWNILVWLLTVAADFWKVLSTQVGRHIFNHCGWGMYIHYRGIYFKDTVSVHLCVFNYLYWYRCIHIDQLWYNNLLSAPQVFYSAVVR